MERRFSTNRNLDRLGKDSYDDIFGRVMALCNLYVMMSKNMEALKGVGGGNKPKESALKDAVDAMTRKFKDNLEAFISKIGEYNIDK